jgi:hypothetical protein
MLRYHDVDNASMGSTVNLIESRFGRVNALYKCPTFAPIEFDGTSIPLRVLVMFR